MTRPKKFRKGDRVQITFRGVVLNTVDGDGLRIAVVSNDLDDWWAIVPACTATPDRTPER